MRTLHISDKLSLPTDVITQTLVVYGSRGTGKTNFLAVLCEEMSAAGLRWDAIDPMGVLYGLRHSADGNGPGLECLILGGRHGDIPIEPTGGSVVADLVVDEDVNVIIDISRSADGKMWSKRERIRFVTAYITRLYERQGEKMHPRMQIIDEAARFAPQIARKGDEQVEACLGAIEQMVEEGRNIGIGVTLVSQRSARLNKNVAELAEAMIAFRTIGPRSIDAILDWFGEHIPKERWNSLAETIRKLPIGSALVVSPGWLEYEGVAAMRARETFDSSATPKAGKERRPRGKGASVDLERYQARMKETVERLQQDNPTALRRRVVELERALAAKAPAPAPAPEVRERPIIDPKALKRVESVVDRLTKLHDRVVMAYNANATSLQIGAEALAKAMIEARQPAPSNPGPRFYEKVVARPAPAQVRLGTANGGRAPSAAALRVLEAIAGLPQPVSHTQTARVSGYRPKGGGFNNILSALRSAGYITGSGERIHVTDEGRALVPDAVRPRSGQELREMWKQKLPPAQWRVLEVLIRAYPAWLTKTQVAEACTPPYDPDGGGFNNILSALSAAALIERENGTLRASDAISGE